VTLALQLSGLFFASGTLRRAMISFLFLLLIVLVIGAMPAWPYSRRWGYYPSGMIAVIMSVLILLAISGRL